MTLAIETKQLEKRYGNFKAVCDLSLQVNPGEIYAFLGLNGAGKTTTIRMLLGMIKASSGVATVLGQTNDPENLSLWSKVGYLVETPHAYPELTVRENLEVSRRLHPGVHADAVENVIRQLSLDEYKDRRAGTLSLGNAQRLGLAKAIMHKPSLLILDEPANGLDPAGIVEIRELLQSLTKTQGVTVFMSSHILGEVNRLADRIGIIHQGKLIQELSTTEVENNRKRSLQITVRQPESAQQLLVEAGYHPVLVGGGNLELFDSEALESPDIVATKLVMAGQPPLRLTVDEEDLEQYFLRLVGGNGRG